MKKVQVEILEGTGLGKLPEYETEFSSGMDVRACFDDINIAFVEIPPGKSILIKTGIKVAIPDGFEIQVRPRSGLAYKHIVTVLNTPGTIDLDYRGDIGVILINHSEVPFKVNNADRIAQIVLCPIVQIDWKLVSQLSETVRGECGFGHTGKN